MSETLKPMTQRGRSNWDRIFSKPKAVKTIAVDVANDPTAFYNILSNWAKKRGYKRFRIHNIQSSQPTIAERMIAALHKHQPWIERMKAMGEIDMRNNHRVITHPNGYVSIGPIDPNKRFGFHL